jgi:undecaprenyl-diphosphatase
MFSFGTDYYLFVFAASLGVLQIAASIGRLRGLLILKHPLVARASGLALAVAAFIWFFSTDTRNLNDNQGGLDANIQALLFLLGALTALAVTIVVPSLVNARMSGHPAPGEGLDALKYTNYVKALSHSIRYWWREWRTRMTSSWVAGDRVAPMSLALALIGLLLVGVVFLWLSDWESRPLLLDRAIVSPLMDRVAHADEAVFRWINGWVGRSSPLDRGMEWVVSDYLVPVSLALTLTGLWFVGDEKAARMKNQIAVFVALSAMGLASWVVFVNNALYFRPRPFVDHDVSLLFYQPTDSSFPANTTAATFAIAAAVWGVNRRVGLALYLAAGLYGFARVYAGVHYPLDIVGGALIGVVVAFLVFKLMELLEPLPTMVIKLARILCLA